MLKANLKKKVNIIEKFSLHARVYFTYKEAIRVVHVERRELICVIG